MKQQFLKRMMAVLGVTLMAVTTVGCGSNSSGDVTVVLSKEFQKRSMKLQ